MYIDLIALLLVLCLAVANGAAAVTAPDAGLVLKTLRPGHPRLILTDEALVDLRSRVATDPVAAGYLSRLRERGEEMLTQPPVERAFMDTHRRLLAQSRRALDRVSTLALLYQLDGNRKWADRAIAEVRVVVGFTDWGPEQFLDVAEMTAAVSFGYDWLYDVLTSEDRAAIRTALIEKGLKPALPFYRGDVDTSVHVPWAQVNFNWNIVCNGGMILGALAIADDSPELSGRILREALSSLPQALGSYAPDGGWPEGPGYWAYATQYLVYTAHALRSALGSDYGIIETPGISATGYFARAMVGPSGESFNYADNSTGRPGRFIQYGLARWFRDPALAYLTREGNEPRRVSPFDLVWYSAEGTAEDVAALPRDHCFSRIHVATLRSSWTDPQALFVGFKAGSNAAVHGHLDLGSFVLDALGVRWADDLGPDNYDLPGYWDYAAQRGTYYRLGTIGHNTLLLDGKNQHGEATAKITAFGSRDDQAFAIADLTDAYTPAGATRARRGVALLDGRTRVLVQDEIAAKDPVEVVWSMHTRAEIALDPDGTTAALSREGKTLHVHLLSPAGARFSAEEVTIPPPQRSLEGERKLLVRLSAKTAQTRIVVALSPAVMSAEAGTVTPLDGWK